MLSSKIFILLRNLICGQISIQNLLNIFIFRGQEFILRQKVICNSNIYFEMENLYFGQILKNLFQGPKFIFRSRI